MSAGDLLNQARTDWLRFSAEGGFEVKLTFKSPSGLIAVANGLAPITHQTVGTDGQVMNGKNVRVTVAEKLLINAGYPIRGQDGDVRHNGHTVRFADARNVSKTYALVESYPDEMTGMLTFDCGNYVG